MTKFFGWSPTVSVVRGKQLILHREYLFPTPSAKQQTHSPVIQGLPCRGGGGGAGVAGPGAFQRSMEPPRARPHEVLGSARGVTAGTRGGSAFGHLSTRTARPLAQPVCAGQAGARADPGACTPTSSTSAARGGRQAWAVPRSPPCLGVLGSNLRRPPSLPAREPSGGQAGWV